MLRRLFAESEVSAQGNVSSRIASVGQAQVRT